MKRLLSLYLYYFTWQRTMTWTSGIGAVFLALALFVPTVGKFFAVLAGSILAVGFPLSFAGIAFRQLVSNRRFVLVPRFRIFAAAALFVFAVTCTAIAIVFAALGRQVFPDDFTLEPATMGLLAFSVVSVYLLLTQWLAAHALGFVGFVLVPLAVIRFGFIDDPIAARLIAQPALLLALTIAAWIWLFLSMRRPTIPRPLATRQWELGTPSDPDQGRPWQPSFGAIASAGGTLLRGARDGWQSRFTAALLSLLTFPVAMAMLFWIIGAPIGNSDEAFLAPGFFLVWSLFGTTFQSEMVHRELPARLRYLWLRRRGTRADGWRFVEHHVLHDALLITAFAAVIALLYAAFTDTALRLLVFYVVGCALMVPLASYFAILARASGWHSIIEGLFLIFVFLFLMGNVLIALENDTVERIVWLAPILGVPMLIVRWLAKRKVLRIDWCAIRPVRMTRHFARPVTEP